MLGEKTRKKDGLKVIEYILGEIALALERKHVLNSEEFSMYLEDYLCDNYDKMYLENSEITKMLNEEIPEICASMEPGLDDNIFIENLKLEYEKANELFYS